VVETVVGAVVETVVGAVIETVVGAVVLRRSRLWSRLWY
jgi:hypothetical protein